MYTISKEFHFSASHILRDMPEGHPCGRLHGHNYIVVVVLADRALDSKGFVQDYGDLKPFKEFIDNALDHKHLNDLPPFCNEKDRSECWGWNPTAENIARFIYNTFKPQFPMLKRIGISETPKTMAWYEED